MRVDQSAIIHRSPDEVFTFLENRANDTAWMKSVRQSEWLDSSGVARVGRRGRMVIKIFGRRSKFIDEVTEYVPGRRIAHRTIEGPFPLNTACICEPADHGCLATVVGELDRVPGGWIGRLATPYVRRIIQHGFKADLARLKTLLEPQPDDRDLVRAQMHDSPTMKDFGDFYNARKAASELRRYRNKGPIPSTKMLIDVLTTESVEGATVIDIGGGISALQHELLAAGAAHVTSVDASDAYIQTAREESGRRGLIDRVTYHHGDFLELAETIPSADIVTLDRVINVYPDWKRLVQVSAARAGRLYGLVYPRNTLPVRLVVSLMNFLVWRGPVHASVPSPDVIDRLTSQAGLVRFFSKTTGPWQVAVYRRHSSGMQGAPGAGGR
jgi:magnesium-protoporphyrin O-methyltransferase